MTFSRDDLATYEKQPQTQVADPVTGAAPAADDKTNAASTAKTSTTNTANTPSGDDVESDKPSVTGEDGTSDEKADSSTATADPSGESDPADETVSQEGDEAPAGKQTPKKGSAAERVQEVLDLMDGYKEFGKHVQDQLKEALAENARLKSGGTQASKTDTESAPPVDDNDDPMPDLADPDVNFDTDKLRAKTQKWLKTQIAKGTQSEIRKVTGQTAAEKLEADVNAKVNTFAKTHKDWETVVAKNPVLISNQLSQPASLAIAQSEHTAEILYKFGKDPGLAVKVAKQSPAQQLITLGKIEAQVEAEKAAEAAAADTSSSKGDKGTGSDTKSGKQKSLTQAPPPPHATKAAGRPNQREVTDPNMSMDDFAKRHREEKQAHRANVRKARGQ